MLGAYGSALMLHSRYEQPRGLAKEAAAVAREVGARADEAHSLATLGAVRAYLGEPERGLATLERAREVAARASPAELLRAVLNLSDVNDMPGRIDTAARVAAEGHALALEQGFGQTYGMFLAANAAEFLTELGRYEEADAYLARGADVRDAAVSSMHVRLQRARLSLGRGRVDDARADLESVLRFGGGMASGAQFRGPIAVLRANLAMVAERTDEALAAVHAGLDETESADGLRRHGAELYAVGLRAAARLGPPGRTHRSDASPAWAAHALVADAEWLTLTGADAGAAWPRATRALDELGLRPTATQARLRHAEWVLPRDRDEAAPLLRRAWQSALQMGAGLLLQRAEHLAGRGRLRLGERAPSGALGLTPRELEVLGLVAEGRSNRQIGEVLFISAKTVSVHVSHILAKLGVSGRVEGAAIAHRAGLVTVSRPHL